MSVLFQIENRAVIPNPETLVIYPFNEIWERAKKRETAMQEFAYIEFMSSMKKSNPYRQYPEDKKDEVIKKDIIKDKKWEADNLVKEGIKKIKEFQEEASTTYSYYMAAKNLAEKMKNFFNDFDITEVNPKTLNPIYKPKDITSALIDTEKVLSNLKSLEKKVEEELFEEVKSRANKEISPFADPSSLN